MADWEFLLQQEGDRTWLPLETAEVEILEGRYRIAGRCHQVNTAVQVQVTYRALEEENRIRRSPIRQIQTNGEGLMLVIPFTRFRPGWWDITCQIAPEVVNNQDPQNIVDSQYTIQVTVLATDEEVDTSDVEELGATIPTENESNIIVEHDNMNISQPDIDIERPDIERPDIEQSDIEQSDIEQSDIQPVATVNVNNDTSIDYNTNIDHDTSIDYNVNIDQANLQPVLDITNESAEIINTGNTPVDQLPDQLLDQVIDQLLDQSVNINQDYQSWQLLLDKDSYTAKTGEIVFLSGQISAVFHPHLPVSHTTLTISNCYLKICLRDPQNFQILSEQIESVPETNIPVNFAVTIAIPDAINTHLILGEISLNNQTTVILQQSFTISSPIEDWLIALQDSTIVTESQTQKLITAKPYRPSVIKPPSFINLVTAINPYINIDQNALESLPPQISPIGASQQSSGKHIDLPSFGHTPRESVLNTGKFADLLTSLTNLPANPELLPESLPESFSVSAIAPTNTPTDTPTNTPESEQVLETINDSLESAEQISDITATTDNIPSNELSPDNISPIEKGFKQLNIEGRFMSRLNALTNDEELSDWLKTLLPPPLTENQIVEEEPIIEEVLSAPEEIAPVEIKTEDQEIVIIDDTWEELAPITQRHKLKQLGENLAEIQVPTPELQVLTPEIMPGRKVAVRISVPDSLQRVYVKLWVYDRQMQTIVYGPQWLTEFTPSSSQKLEVIHDLEVPYGCLELQFEAIAVEMTSNQESHKIIVERQVVPPPPPKLPLE